MAKARIIYDVDDKELDALIKKLEKVKKENQSVEDGFKGSNEELKKTGGVLGDLKSTIAGLGLAAAATAALTEFAKLTQEIIKNRKEVAQLTGATGKALDTITAKLKATSQVFNQDFNETLRTANTLSKEFNISMSEAIKEVNEGFSRGLDINGDYLETLREYSTFISEAGISTRQFNVLIQQQVQQGIFSDKGIDAIKEAVISIREMTPATRDAIRAIGIDTDQLIGDIRSGATTYFEAVQQIATKTRELADPQKTGVILADVFRGAGEDAGNFVFTLDQVGTEFGQLTEEQEKYRKSTQDLLQSQEELDQKLVEFSNNFTGLNNQLKIFLNETGIGFIKFFDDLFNGFDNLDKKTKSLKDSFGSLTKQEASAELENLTQKATQLEKVIADIDAKGEDFFQRVFGVGNNGKKAREDLEEVNLQISVLNDLLKEKPKQIEDEKEATKQIAEQKTEVKELTDLKRKGIEEEKSDFIKQVEARQERNELIKETEEELQEDLTEINKGGIDKRTEAEEEAAERRQELTETAINGISEIFSSFQQLRIDQIGQEIQANELARNRELELAEGNAQKQEEINKTYDRKQADLKTKQANAQKIASLFDIGINTGVGITKTIAQLGLPAAIPFVALAAALGAAQAAFVLAQPIPKFAKGTLFVDGPGGVDQVPSMLTRGESVFPVDTTKDYYPALKAIYTRNIDPDIINNIARNGGSQANITVNDYDKLAKAVMNQPQFNISMNESGFSYFAYRQNKKLEYKQNKFKF